MTKTLKLIAVIIALMISYSVIFYMGTQHHHCPPAVETEVYCYDLDSGKNGVIRFSTDQDSLAHVVFVENKDTFALDYLSREEFDSLLTALYPNRYK